MSEQSNADELLSYLRRATTELVETRRQLTLAQSRPGTGADDPIAVVGMACRIPGGIADPEEFHTFLCAGGDAMSPFPSDRGWQDIHSTVPQAPGSSVTATGGFLPAALDFDAELFEISPRIALATDPAHRVLLETAWQALEHAGIDPTSLSGSDTGVFAGCMYDHYSGRQLPAVPSSVEGSLLTSSTPSVLSGRLSYTFGLQGPAITIDTACSTSLVAVHLAARSLRHRECSLALAGGVTVMSDPGLFVEFSRQGALAADGHAKPFAAGANGTAWSEGSGLLVLERLADAERRGHRVLAIVRGSAINQDGRSNGMTAPSGPAQERVIRSALADAGLTADEVDVAEAHGTGTALGDPIEAAALLATYGAGRPTDRPLLLGSVKGNIGHTQAAAGVLGLIKVIQSIRHGVLPSSLHAQSPTPHVDWSTGGVRLAAENWEFPARERPRRGAVSSFGISGTNSHVIIEQAPNGPDNSPTTVTSGIDDAGTANSLAEKPGIDDPLIWVLRARTDSALRRFAGRLIPAAAEHSDVQLRDDARWLARRASLPHRAVIVAADRDELLLALTAISNGDPHPAAVVGSRTAAATVLVFPGQGTQWAGMAAELLAQDPSFARVIDTCDAALSRHLPYSVRQVLEQADGAPELTTVDVVQPTLFAVMVALAELWRNTGIEPDAVIGHSQGEIAAAYVCGALSLSDAAAVVAERAKALTALAGTGAMVSVALPADQVERMLLAWPDKLWIAVQSGAATVVAGEIAAAEEFIERCPETIRIRRIAVDYASHTPQMEPLGAPLAHCLAEVAPNSTTILFGSGCAGGLLDSQELTADYWFQNLRQPVLFDQAVLAVAEQLPEAIYIECSPHPVLAGDLADQLPPGTGVCPTLRRGLGGRRQFLTAVAKAYTCGAGIDWPALLGEPSGLPGQLPGYAFDRQRYWLALTPGAGTAPMGVEALSHPLLGAAVGTTDGGLLVTGRVSLHGTPWVAGHEIGGAVLVPGAVLIEIAAEVAAVAGCDGVVDLTLTTAVVLRGDDVELRVSVDAESDGRRAIRIAVGTDAGWVQSAEGTIGQVQAAASAGAESWPPPAAEPLDVPAAYATLADRGYAYGPAFRGVTAAWQRGSEIFAEITLPADLDASGFGIHPALLDAAMQPLLMADSAGDLRLPFAVSGVRIEPDVGTALRIRMTSNADDVQISGFDQHGREVLHIAALRARPVDRAIAGSTAGPLYRIEWSTVDLPTGLANRTRPWRLQTAEAPMDRGQSGVLGVDLRPAGDDPVAAAALALSVITGWLSEVRPADSMLALITSGGAGPGASDPAAAAIWGLGRTAQAEHPGRLVLIDVDQTPTDWATLDAAVTAGQSQLVLRSSTVSSPLLVPLAAVGTAHPQEFGAIDPDRTVLITGGAGGLAGPLAEHLAHRHGARHLLLVSRRGDQTPGADELGQRLAAAGAQLRQVAADICDPAALRGVLDSIDAEHPLGAVVHTAGVLDDATLEATTADQLQRVFAAKVGGALHLDELTADLPLTTFVLFSSLAGVLGNPGQAGYAAANAALDALAARRRAAGRPAVAIAWGLWDLRTGMTGSLDESDRRRLARAGIAPLTAAQGWQQFDAALLSTEAAVVAAVWEYGELRKAADAGTIPAMLQAVPGRQSRAGRQVRSATPAPTGAAALAEQLGALPPEAARTLVGDLVARLVAEVLAHPDPDRIDRSRPFVRLGLDSLTAVELRNRIDAATGLRLPPTVAFDHPTLASLADHLCEQLAPDPPNAEDIVRGLLEQLTTSLQDVDELTRRRLSGLARSTFRRLDTAGPLADQLSDATSDDEILALIDEQF